MKKKISIVLAVLFAVSLMTGCSQKADKSGATNEITNKTESFRINVWDYEVDDYMTLGEYKNLAVTVKKDEITDEMVDSQAFSFYLNQVTKEHGGIVDRAVATGDTVVMDYVGKQDGVAFDGGTDSNATLTIGSGQFIDGFEDGLIGVMPGETVDLELTFPEQYHSAALAGAEVVFTVTVHYIQPTEMEDEAVAGFGNEKYKNVEELKQYAREALNAQAEYQYQLNLEAAVLNALLSNCTFKEVPEGLLAQSEKNVKNNIETTAAMYGMDASTYVKYSYQMDYETFLTRNSIFSTQLLMATYAVAEKEEGLFPEGKELEKTLEEIAASNNMDSMEELLAEVELDVLRENILYENVLEYLIENAQVSE